MTGNTPKARRELDWILEILRENPHGLAVGEIADALKARHEIRLTPYAVSYRLKHAPDGAVERDGRGRGTRYRPGGGDGSPDASIARSGGPHTSSGARTAQSWLSAEGAEALEQVRSPRGARKYVGYNRTWLEAYEPNKTEYIPSGAKAHLHRLGRTPEGDRPAGTYAREILSRLLIDLSWASSRLEGNTYSRLDTQNLIEFGERAEGKDATEAQMILNHKGAIEFLVDGPVRTEIDALTLRSLHARLADGLLPDPRDEGGLRRRPVSITNSTYVPAEDPHLIAECFERIIRTANAIHDPFERSFFLLAHLPYLQPFADVNKRTARLAANIPLIAENLCPLTFVDVPEKDYIEATLAIYELRETAPLRDLYVWAYERSTQLYAVAREAAVPPDPLRLRYRSQLREFVAASIRGGHDPDVSNTRAWALNGHVDKADASAFAEMAITILRSLNDASATRYGVSPLEFSAWRARAQQ